MAQPIKLNPEQVLEISVIDTNNAYKGKKAGKFYSRYRYDGIVFTVDNDNPFVNAFADGQVKTAKLNQSTREKTSVNDEGEEIIETVNTLEFDSFISRAQYNALQQDRVVDASVEARIKRYETIATMPITSDMLAELEAIA